MTKQHDNTAVLAAITVDPARLTWFDAILKNWPSQWAGSKPTASMLMVPLLLDGKRPGKEAGHIAMCLRPEGCTVQQFQTAFSCGPANNYRRALVKTGWLTQTVQGKPYAFTMTVTAKGEARLKKAMDAAAAEKANEAAERPKAKKAKAKRKAKAQPAQPVSEPAPIVDAGAVVVSDAPDQGAVEQPQG